MSGQRDALISGHISMRMLGRAFAILRSVSAAGHPVGVSDLARLTGIPKSTVHRLLDALTDHGMLARRDQGLVPGAGVHELAELSNRRRDAVRDLLIPYLVELHVRTGDAVMAGVLDHRDVIVLETLFGHDQSAGLPVARRLPAEASALGRTLLEHRHHLLPPSSFDLLDAGHLLGKLPPVTHHRGSAIFEVGVWASDDAPGVTQVAAPVSAGRGVVAAVGRWRQADDAGDVELHRRICAAASARLRDGLRLEG